MSTTPITTSMTTIKRNEMSQTTAGRLTREQQRELAALVMGRIADIAEFWEEMTEDSPSLTEADYHAACAQLARWANRLPGDIWDTRLPDPS